MSVRALAATSVLLLGSAGCRADKPESTSPAWFSFDTGDAIRMSRHDVHLRYDAPADALELVELCFDVEARAGKESALRAEFDGARVFPASQPWIPFDVDAWVEDARRPTEAQTIPPLRGASPEIAARLLELESGVQVVETAYFLDERDHLGLLRRWKLERFTDVVRFLDDVATAVDRVAKESPSDDALDDPQTIAARNAWIDAKRPRARVDGESLVFDLPMSPTGAVRALNRAIHGADGTLAGLLEMADALRVTDDHMEVTLRGTDGGWLRIAGRDDGRPTRALTPEGRAELTERASVLSAQEAARRIGLERLPPPRDERVNHGH